RETLAFFTVKSFKNLTAKRTEAARSSQRKAHPWKPCLLTHAIARKADRRDLAQGFWLRVFLSQHLGLAPFAVAARDHHVEAPLAAFLLGFDQSKFFQRAHVFFHPLDLIASHAAALQINGNSSEMG